MKTLNTSKLFTIELKKLTLGLIIFIIFNQIATYILNAFYAASRYPVAYFVAQTSFSSEKIKSYYEYMIEVGTMNIYIQTQLIDFIFIFSVAFLHVTIGLIIYELMKVYKSRLLKLSRVMVYIVLIAPLADALENLVSFIMLVNPLTFADWLVYLYSGFATLKFFIFMVSYTWFIIGFIVAIYSLVSNKLRHKTVI